MPKLDKSVYRGFLNTLDKARENKSLVTLHFFRDPTLRGYIEEIDTEVYVATVLSEEGNCSQIRLSQITSITWRKNGEETLTPKNLNLSSRKKNIKIEEIEREKLEETETATEYMKRKKSEEIKEKNKEEVN